MHDVLEGICRYEVALILYHYIYVEKYFSLDLLNERIESFNYGDGNKPPGLTEKNIKKTKLLCHLQKCFL